MAAKNLIARIIDHYENLSQAEVRLLLEWLLAHWTSDQRRQFKNEWPLIAEKLNPGSLNGLTLKDILKANRIE